MAASAAASTAAPGSTPPSASATASASPSAAIARNPAELVPGAEYGPAIDPAAFTTTIDNPRFPLIVGTTTVFDGGGEHTETTVTDKTRVVIGIEAVVVRDRVFEDDALIEDTEDYYAQDEAGNVWYLGEDTAECEEGKVTSTEGAWLAGVDGAQPGVQMLADPRPDDRYRQEFYAGEAEDQARIVGTEPSVTVPAGTYDDVLVIEETTPLEPDLLEQKVYASGVGPIEERTLKGGSGVVRLTSIATGSGDVGDFVPCRG
jgi:hypothetical protein